MVKRVAIVDEHEVFRRGVVAILEDEHIITVVSVAAAGPVPIEADVIVASPNALRALSADPRPVVVCWGPRDPPLAHYVGRSVVVLERDLIAADELACAVRAVAAGLRLEGVGSAACSNRSLDARCRHVLRMLADGADTRRISRSLCYSERTVKALIGQIAEELSAHNRAEAVAKGIRLGLI